jgi:hypothetical protein
MEIMPGYIFVKIQESDIRKSVLALGIDPNCFFWSGVENANHKTHVLIGSLSSTYISSNKNDTLSRTICILK